MKNTLVNYLQISFFEIKNESFVFLFNNNKKKKIQVAARTGARARARGFVMFSPFFYFFCFLLKIFGECLSLVFLFLNHRKQMIVYIHLSDVHTHSLARTNIRG